jgi:hypothetical protein
MGTSDTTTGHESVPEEGSLSPYPSFNGGANLGTTYSADGIPIPQDEFFQMVNTLLHGRLGIGEAAARASTPTLDSVSYQPGLGDHGGGGTLTYNWLVNGSDWSFLFGPQIPQNIKSEKNAWVFTSPGGCSIKVKFAGKLSSGTPGFPTGPNHRRLGNYTSTYEATGDIHHGFRFEVTGSVAYGAIGRIGDPSSSTSIALPGGGQWRIGQWKFPSTDNNRNGVPSKETGITTEDSPLYFDRKFGSDVNVAVHGNTFGWQDQPGLSENSDDPLVSGTQNTGFVVYATDGDKWCGIYFNITSSFANGQWRSTIHLGQLH